MCWCHRNDRHFHQHFLILLQNGKRWMPLNTVTSHERHGVSNRMFSNLFKLTWKHEENPPAIGGFPSQSASNAERVSVSWRHHAKPKHATRQWGTTLQCNVVPHWLGTCTKNDPCIWGSFCELKLWTFGYRCVGSRWHLHYKWWRHSDAFVQSHWPWVSSSGHNLLKYSVLINLNLSCFVQCIYMMYVNCILWRPRYRTILYYACLNEDMKLTVVLLVISYTYFLHVNSFPLNKMVAITQTTFSNAFSWVEMYRFRLKFPRV